MIAAVQALVRVDGVEIPYLRAGRGPAVLLLTGMSREEDEEPLPGGGAVLEILSLRFRVIAPLQTPPPGRTTGAHWIRGIIDGLGLDRPMVITEADQAPLLLRAIARDPGRLGAVLILPVDLPGEEALRAECTLAFLQSLLGLERPV